MTLHKPLRTMTAPTRGRQSRALIGLVFLLSTCAASAQEAADERDQPNARPSETESAAWGGEEDAGFGGVDDATDFADLSLEELMDVQVVVTAARHEQKITTVPFAISVVTADDIRAAGARSIPDALRLVPGMDVADLSHGNAAVSPRGFHGFIANQVLVLVDGRQIFDSLFGGTLWGSWPFQLEDIERIEVIRGPGGVTWGANAANGVINIITKDPGDQIGLTSTSGGGSRGSFKQHLGYGLQEGNLRLRVSGEYEASDGFRKGGSLLRNLADDYKGGRLSLHAVYDKDENNTFTLSTGSGVVDGGFPPTPLAGFGLRRNSGSQASFLLGKWSHQVAPDNRFDLTGYVNDFHASPGLPAIDYRYQQFGLLFRHTFQPAEKHTLTWGVDGRADLLDASNADPFMLSKSFVSTGIIGLFLQDDWRFAPRWVLGLGGRVDYEFYGGFQPSARASLAYELSDDAMVYGAVSRAFHMPTAAGRFLSIPLLSGISRVTANRDFDPTTLLAYEVGYRGKLFDRLDTGINLFWHQYDEVTTISPGLGPPGLIQNRFDNRSGSASLFGAELEARYKVSDKLTLLGNYTYQQLKWNVSEPFTERDYITPPKHKAMLGARYAVTDDLHLASHLYFVDAVKAPNPSNPFLSRRIDPYLRLDLRAEYELWNDQASFSVGVRNLLDSGHFEGSTLFMNDAESPRMVFAEFRIRVK
ncbi:MAG: TonB-dependent receptor plug domain-containing protein [Phycisphaerae bacterium]